MAYTDGMSWKDYLTDSERAELARAIEKRDRVIEPAKERFRAVYRKLKARADTRAFRAKDGE